MVPVWSARSGGILEELESLGACPVCSDIGVASIVPRPVGLTVSLCAGCGVAYLDPRPTWSSMLRHYETDYAFAFLPLAQQWADAEAFDILKVDARRIDRLKPLPGTTVMDVGCGPGLMLATLRRHGSSRIFGIEPSRDAASFAARMLRGASVLNTTWEAADRDLGRAEFDVITGLDLIEHLYDPRAFVRWSRARLAPRGLLYLKTPNWAAATRYGDSWHGLAEDFEHVCYFDRPSLSRLLEDEGFVVRAVAYEPARAGLGGTVIPQSRGGGARKRLRAAVRTIPGLNSIAYEGLQRVRRLRKRADIAAGTADVLVVLASR